MAIYYPPKAIAKGIELSAAATVTVSLPPSLVSVKVMFDPAVSLASSPAVVSFDVTFTVFAADAAELAAAVAELAAAVAEEAALVADVDAADADEAAAVADVEALEA